MKRVMAFALSLTLGAFAAQAQTPAAAPAKTTHKKMAPKTDPAVAAQLDALKQAMDAQQAQIKQLSDQVQSRDQQIQQLQQKVDQSQAAATDAAGKADSAASTASQQSADVTALKSDVSDLKLNSTNAALSMQDTQKVIAGEKADIKMLGNLKFSGDLRLRYEPFFGGGLTTATASPTRNRERYRLRFNMATKVDNDFTVGFSLASGDLGDPISTNSTNTGFYTRKPIAIDKAFAAYNPHTFKPFTLTVGKFGYTVLRTELTWDNDLNWEGGSAALAYNWDKKFLNHLAVVAVGTDFFEVSGGPDSYMVGGQLQTGWTLLPRVKLTADAAYYDFANADSIAQNQGQVPADGFATQGTTNAGGGNFGFSASTLSNNFGVVSGKRYFASKYGVLDAIARLDIDTGHKRWPIYSLVDFAQNTLACDNLSIFIVNAVAPPTCDKRQRHAYWGELQLGQTKNKGDMMLNYTFIHIERDAVLSAFDFSDIRQPTNVGQHRLEAYYQAAPHVQVGVTGLIGRQLVTAQSAVLERYLKRWQFDTIFAF
jgi:Putative porin